MTKFVYIIPILIHMLIYLFYHCLEILNFKGVISDGLKNGPIGAWLGNDTKGSGIVPMFNAWEKLL